MVWTLLAAGSAWGAPDGVVLQSFEGDGFGDWRVEGGAFGAAPVAGEVKGLGGRLSGYAGGSLVCSAHGGSGATGSLTSPKFVLNEDFLAFLVAGGSHASKTAVQLLVDGEVKLEATGDDSLQCRRVVWDVGEWKGSKAEIRIVDSETKDGGMIAADHFVLTASEDPAMPPTERDRGSTGHELVVTEVIPGLSIPKGTKVSVLADHESHGVTSPTALAFDEAGGLYVTETHRFRRGVEDDRDHLEWYLDDLAAETLEDRKKLIEKWQDKFPEGYFTEHSEVVRRLVGRGEDDRFESATVFAEGFNDALDGTAAGVFALDGVVYLASIPKIHTLADRNGDGVADERGVVQDGFGVRFSLSGHDLNGFELGPDGRLYGTVGDRGFNFTTAEGVSYEFPDQGAVFRFDPDGSNFEVIHTGLRNPKEIAFDAYGNAFSVDNNSDQGDKARVVYVVDGADSGWRMGHQAMHTFHRQIGLPDRPLGMWMEERMWEPANDKQPASILPPVANLTSGPSGLTYHPGTGFLESEQGRFLICDYRGGGAASGIWSFAVEPSGGGMKLVDSRKFIWGTGATDVTYSWGGRLVVSDFISGWKAHEGGRIYQLEADAPHLADQAKETAVLIAEGFSQRSVEGLGELLAHSDMRVRTRAHLELTRKEGGLEKLVEIAENADGFARLHAIWGLGVIARRGEAARPLVVRDEFVDLPDRKLSEAAWGRLLGLLASEDAEVRAQTVKVLGESGIVGDRINFGALFEDDSPRVRMLAAIAAGRTKAAGSLTYLWDLIVRNDNQDPYIRHAGAYALAKISNSRQLFVLHRHESPALRLAALVALGKLEDEGVGWFLNDPDPAVVAEAIRIIHDKGIESVRPLVVKLLDGAGRDAWSEMIWMRVLHSAYRVGTAEQVERVLGTALDEAVPLVIRKEALRLLAAWSEPSPVDQSLGRYAPLPQRDPEVAAGAMKDAAGKLMRVDAVLRDRAIQVIQAHQLDTTLIPDEELEAGVRDGSLPGKVRAKTLELYLSRQPEGMDPFLVELSAMDEDALALAAIRQLVKTKRPEAVEAIRAALESSSVRRLQEGWRLAASLDSPAVDELILQHLESLEEALGVGPAAIELLTTARKRETVAIQDALKRFDAKVSESDDPLAVYFPSLEGGDPRRGKRLFESHPGGQCMRCHSENGGHGSGLAGPALAGVAGRGDRLFLLESLTHPGTKVASGYGMVSVSLKDGSSVGGTLVEEMADRVVLDVAGESRTISRDEIVSLSEPVSAMPPMGAVLSPEELRDLVAWLASLEDE